MFDTGYLHLGRIRGAPVRIHWSVALGALFFTGLRFEPAAWLAFLLLVLIHELGHAAVVLACRLRVVSVDVLAFGGLCRWSGDSTALQRALISWGGVAAQAVLYAATWAFVLLAGHPTSRMGDELVSVFTETNLWVAMLNLLPIPPLDGAGAWTIFKAWKGRRRGPGTMSGARRELRRIEDVDRGGSLSEEDEARIRRLFENVKRD